MYVSHEFSFQLEKLFNVCDMTLCLSRGVNIDRCMLTLFDIVDLITPFLTLDMLSDFC